MSDASRDELLQRLGELMSDVSERCYSAQWMGDTLTAIESRCRRALLDHEPQPWGIDEISVAEATELWSLAAQVGGWPEPDWDGNFDTYVCDTPFTSL